MAYIWKFKMIFSKSLIIFLLLLNKKFREKHVECIEKLENSAILG